MLQIHVLVPMTGPGVCEGNQGRFIYFGGSLALLAEGALDLGLKNHEYFFSKTIKEGLTRKKK